MQNHKLASAMQNKQLSQEGPDGQSRRLEYKSPTLRKLGKLTDMTLAVANNTTTDDGGKGQTHKTG
jgi:hypothetical protein